MNERMENLISIFPKHLATALDIGHKVGTKSDSKKEIKNIIIAGMGGSGIGGDIVKNYTQNIISIPLEVVKNYTIPSYVNEYTLFIASSYSGNTEETIASLQAAIKAGAQVAGVASGGEIKEIIERNDGQCIVIPNEVNCPRAHLGLSFVSLLFVLHYHRQISSSFIEDIQQGIELINSDTQRMQEQARTLTEQIGSRSIIIYSDNTFQPVSLRCQQQLNENAKRIAHINIFPEMNHNELVGWSSSKVFFEDKSIIIFNHEGAHPLVQKRIEICTELFNGKCDHVFLVESKGSNLLEKYIYSFHFVDWVSFYLAENDGVDTFPIVNIDYLKDKLKEFNQSNP